MRKKTLLPFETNPYSTMYHGIAFPMGIIQGNAKTDITPWLCGKYINCWFVETAENKFAYYINDNWPTGDKILFQQRIDIFSNLYKILKIEPISLFRKMLNMGYYVHGIYNEQYIPGKKYFQKNYYSHDFILIGYNDILKKFISVGFLEDGKFQPYYITYDDMIKSIESLKPSKFAYNFWKYNEDYNFLIDLKRIVVELSDYLQSKTSIKMYTQNRYWGIEAMQQLMLYFKTHYVDEYILDHRYTRGLKEHKFYMEKRIEYLLSNGYLKKDYYLRIARDVRNTADIIHMLGIKYNATKNHQVISNICDRMQDIISIEKDYLPEILDDMSFFVQQ